MSCEIQTLLESLFRYSSTNTSAQEQKAPETPTTAAAAPEEKKVEVDVKQLLEQNNKLMEEVNDFRVKLRPGMIE